MGNEPQWGTLRVEARPVVSYFSKGIGALVLLSGDSLPGFLSFTRTHTDSHGKHIEKPTDGNRSHPTQVA